VMPMALMEPAVLCHVYLGGFLGFPGEPDPDLHKLCVDAFLQDSFSECV
ncbi:hypothetical protein A2U01_0087585, partial [Trifolium medium]|nr:hypothetical protein [Trifolium medium]